MSDVLADLMRRLSAGGDAAEFAQRWERSPAPFASVTVRSWASEERPWSDVDVAFAPGAAPTLAELEAAFGPFTEPPRLSSGTRRLRGEWWEDGMPVRVVLNIKPAPAGRDEPLAGLSLQTGMTAPE
jgi:hypothetical protein